MGRTSKNKKGGVDDYDLNASFDQGQPLSLDDLNGNVENEDQINPVNNLPIVNNENNYDDIANDAGPMNIDELESPPPNPEEGLTDTEMDTDDEGMNGGRKTRKNRKTNKRNNRKTMKRKNRKTMKRKNRKTMKRKNRKTNKQRGGGYGTNCAQKDPNFSIYNTRELTLFPYNPTK